MSGVYTLTANIAGCGAYNRFTTVTVTACKMANNEGGDDNNNNTSTDNTSDPISENGNSNDLNTFFKCYPNPFSDQLHMNWNGYEVSRIHLMDIQGKTIMERFSGDSREMVIPTENLSAGVYLLNVETTTGILTYRVTRQ